MPELKDENVAGVSSLYQTSENGSLITVPFEELGVGSSVAIFFINWHLPLQCSLGLSRFSQNVLAIYSLFIVYPATIIHLLNICVSSSKMNIVTAINFISANIHCFHFKILLWFNLFPHYYPAVMQRK